MVGTVRSAGKNSRSFFQKLIFFPGIFSFKFWYMSFQMINNIFNNFKLRVSNLVNYFKSSVTLSSNSIIAYWGCGVSVKCDFNYSYNLRESFLFEVLEFLWKTVDCFEYSQTSYLKEETPFNYRMHVCLKYSMLLKQYWVYKV